MIAAKDATIEDAALSTSYSKEERIWAMLCHLSSFAGYIFPFGNIIAPLLIWVIKRDESELINDQGKEAVNFQISLSIYFVISVVLIFVAVGIPLLIGLVFFHVIVTIIASIRANDGEKYRYPATIRFVE